MEDGENREQALATPENQANASETEQNADSSELNGEAVSDQAAEEGDKEAEAEKDSEKGEEGESEIDLEDPKIKAVVEKVAARMAQSIKDKRIQKLIDDAAAKEQELASYKEQQETDKRKAAYEAQFAVELARAKKELEENGVSESFVDKFINNQKKIQDWWEQRNQEYAQFRKDLAAFEKEKLAFKIGKLTAQYGLSEDEAKDLANAKTDLELEHLALKKSVEKQSKKSRLKPQTPKKIDSNLKSGEHSLEGKSSRELARIGYSKK